jgi:CheY-like chemotaxis protein
VPLSSEVKDKTSSKIAFESNWDIRGQRILVVDDEITVREGMKAVLERWGCDVVLADGIETAVSQASKQDYQFNAIVADYRLRNETTGVQVIEAIHQAANKKIPAMLVTGDTDPQRIQEAKGSGYLLLHKPVAPGKLRTALKVLQSDEQRADEEYRTSSEAPL